MSLVCAVFNQCVSAMRRGDFIERESDGDKEFHFQNWFKARLVEMRVDFDEPGRNTYPDFRLVLHTECYELKGLAYPGRDTTYDCNSQIPRGQHNGLEVFYVFERYPKKPDGNRYPVLDLVICHGSFLNANNTYTHKNKSFQGFGSYGDIMVRDRKMYVAPTPFAVTVGTAHHCTLILPAELAIDDNLVHIATLKRREAKRVVVAYDFDLRTNELKTSSVPNPAAGKEHVFNAYRAQGDPMVEVTLRV